MAALLISALLIIPQVAANTFGSFPRCPPEFRKSFKPPRFDGFIGFSLCRFRPDVRLRMRFITSAIPISI